MTTTDTKAQTLRKIQGKLANTKNEFAKVKDTEPRKWAHYYDRFADLAWQEWETISAALLTAAEAEDAQQLSLFEKAKPSVN